MRSAPIILATVALLIGLSCRTNNSERSIRYADRPINNTRTFNRAAYHAERAIHDAPYSDQATYLRYDLYMPSKWTEERKPPLLVVAHPGGFILGDKSDYLIQKISKDFARLGYATAAINYRLIDPTANARDLTVNGRRRTLINAITDARAAVRFIQKQHGFSPEHTYFLGYSAGGFIGNHIVFSSQEELSDFSKHSLNFSDPLLPSHQLVNGVITIAGGILDFSHLSDKDLANTSLLLIHGDEDQVVPYKYGRPFEKMVDEDLEFELPGLYYDLGGSFGEDDFVIRFEPGIQVQSTFLKVIRDQIYPDEICGSGCIFDDQSHQSGQVQLITVEGGPHSFMHNGGDGQLNRTYTATLRTIQRFLEGAERKQERLGRRRRSR